MKEIQLSKRGKNKGEFAALVDDEDFERVSQYRWSISKHQNTSYARHRFTEFGKQKQIYMHNMIMNDKGIDHADRDGLNCQKSNMRKCTTQQNCMNQKPSKNSTSKYKGVSYCKKREKWQSGIMFNRHKTWLGFFELEIEAAKAYDAKAKELFKEFAYLNFNN